MNDLNFYVSFVDLHIFRQAIRKIEATFNPTKFLPLSEKIHKLVPIKLRDTFHTLRAMYRPELCLEAVLHCGESYEHSLKYCRNNAESFDVRFNRGVL